MAKAYHQYCPIAHALDLVGERWSLLVVRELMHGPLRYSDLHERLSGCGTNILAARLKRLEACGVIAKKKLPPPAASTVYELTSYGFGLRRVMQELARWGVRSLGPPSPDETFDPGWLTSALEAVIEPLRAVPSASVEFRVDDEVASIADGVVHSGGTSEPDAVVVGDPAGFYHLFVDGNLERVEITGDREAVERLVAVAELSDPAPLVV